LTDEPRQTATRRIDPKWFVAMSSGALTVADEMDDRNHPNTASLIRFVVSKLRKIADDELNDLALRRWDKAAAELAGLLVVATRFIERGDSGK
jgi:hypothetical protein